MANSSFASLCGSQDNVTVLSKKNLVTLEYLIEPGVNSGFIANFSVGKWAQRVQQVSHQLSNLYAHEPECHHMSKAGKAPEAKEELLDSYLIMMFHVMLNQSGM